jgi:hypothetical protein
MKSLHPQFDLLLASVSQSEGEAAREVLAAKGIASKLERRAFDSTELGASMVHVPRPDLFVPKGSRDAARAILVAAWGEARVAKYGTAT